MDGYCCVSRYRNKKKGGGVSLYINETLGFDVLENLSVINDFIECVFIEINSSSYNLNKNIIKELYITKSLLPLNYRVHSIE